MKVLFDQGTPVPLRRSLPGHAVATAFELGWATLRNGELLDRAEAEGYELLITTDQQLRHQQNLSGSALGHLGAALDILAAHPGPCWRDSRDAQPDAAGGVSGDSDLITPLGWSKNVQHGLRGGLVDKAALLNALRPGRVRAAGGDTAEAVVRESGQPKDGWPDEARAAGLRPGVQWT